MVILKNKITNIKIKEFSSIKRGFYFLIYPLFMQEVEHQLGPVYLLQKLQEENMLQLFMVLTILKIH